MADNYLATQGSGTTFRAKDNAGVLLPAMTLHTDADAALLGQQTMAASLPVVIASNQSAVPTSVASIAAGENHLGAMGGNTTEIDVAIAMTTAGTYATGNFVGTNATPLSFSNAARVSGGTIIVQSAVLVDYALQNIAGELWLFSDSVTPPNDKAAWSISDADAYKCIGVIPFGAYYASALNSISQQHGLSMGGKLAATTLYGAFVIRGAPTYASNDVHIRLTILQD